MVRPSSRSLRCAWPWLSPGPLTPGRCASRTDGPRPGLFVERAAPEARLVAGLLDELRRRWEVGRANATRSTSEVRPIESATPLVSLCSFTDHPIRSSSRTAVLLQSSSKSGDG